MAVALGHIARHRGFRSNSKRDRGANAAPDSSKMLQAIDATREKLARWRTVGEMFEKDDAYAGRKRNRDGEYTRSVLRDDLEREVRALFDTQRRIGNALATVDLEAEFVELAFSQRPLQDSEDSVGECPFEVGNKRAARRSYSFERFRLLSRLAALRIFAGGAERSLSPSEIAQVDGAFGLQKSVSYKTLRELLGLDDDARFAGVAAEEERRDFVARTGAAAEGTVTLRRVIRNGAGESAWLGLLNAPEKLDAVASVLSFREDIGSIRAGLTELGLENAILAALLSGVEQGAFAGFSGAGHISAKACRALIPHLRDGLGYSDACAAAGYTHTQRPTLKLDDIRNPVARKALTEALKQVRAIVREYGLPGAIHVELARDVGKSKDERDEIKRGIEQRNKDKDRLKQEYASVLLVAPRDGTDDLLRFELWKEQNGRCLYTDRAIPIDAVRGSDNAVQVDHILPWSRFGDDSFVNKTLCYAGANQEKRGATPFEWFGAETDRWEAFRQAVEGIKGMKGRKKRNYLLKNAQEREEKMRARNLSDTRYASRLLAEELKRLYPDDGGRHVFARPGALTDRLRRGWGMQSLKKTPTGERVEDDRHHALDALIVAATTESALQRLTLAFQHAEAHGLRRDFSNLPQPWPGFVEETRRMLDGVFVSRAERRRARGEAHAATVRSVVEGNDGTPVVFERKQVHLLTLGDVQRVKDPDRNAKLVEALRAWIESGQPKDAPPRSPKGDPIRKVLLVSNRKVDVRVRGGAAERGEMTRVDVFRSRNARSAWEFFLVPIYPHQVFDTDKWPQPPMHAVQGGRPESAWPMLTKEHQFLWSLHPLSLIEVDRGEGPMRGYFRGLDRSTGSITISSHLSKDAKTKGIGTRTLKSFRKFSVDRLGRQYEIEREIRTWHGVACT